MSDRRLRIFISYTESDRRWARWIGTVVEEAGHQVVMQDWDSPPGENFVLWINREIDGADIMLPVYSPAYFASQWCTIEWTTAINRPMPLIPVMISKCRPPSILRTTTYVNLTGKPPPACKKLLLRGLTRSRGDLAAESGTAAMTRAALADRIARRWKEVAAASFLLGVISATVIFTPGDPGIGGDHSDLGDLGDTGAGDGLGFLPDP